MRRSLIIFLLTGSVLGSALVSARADEHPKNVVTMSWFGRDSIAPQVNHLNRMIGHLRWQLSRYRSDPSIRQDFARIRAEVDRVNIEYRREGYDRRALRRTIEDLHTRLHQLEVRLKVRRSDYYDWR